MGNKTSKSGKDTKKTLEYSQILREEISGALFQKYDSNVNKNLSKGELSKLLAEEFGLDENQIKIAGTAMDTDQSGSVDIDEFKAILKNESLVRVICDTESCKFLSEAWKIFRKHDKDLSGDLTKVELKALLKSLGIPAAAADEILNKADANKNALINFNEFIHWLPATAALLKQYKSQK